MSLAGRTLRRIGLDRNPLRRTIDRVEAWIAVMIVASFLLIVPVTAWLAGRAAWAAGVHTEQVERAHRHRVEAVLLADAGSRAASGTPPGQQGAAPGRAGNTAGLRTHARWTTPDGGERRGFVLAGEDARAGQWVPVWTDARGYLTEPPQQRVQTDVNAVAAATLAGVGAIALAGVLRLFLRTVLDARRMAQWESAWWQFEPRWTGR
jgi:hypothetical protein